MSATDQRSQPLNRWDAILSVALTALTLGLFLYFLTPPFLSDQLDYFYHAWRMDDLQPNHRHLRIGLIFMAWLAIRLFGYSELGYYAIPALSALLLVLGTWFVGRMLFERWVGALAAVLAICNPWVLPNITDLLPDYLAVSLYTTGIGILLWCWRNGRLSERPADLTTYTLLLIAGLLIGWAYLAREYVVILFPSLLVSLIVMRAHAPRIVVIALGAALCWLLELVWGFMRYDDPLARFHAVASPRSVSRFVEMDIVGILLQLPHLFLDRSGFFDQFVGLTFVSLFLVGMFASIRFSMRGDRRWQILASWLVGGWLFFTLIALLPPIFLGEERVYLRMHKFRYWAMILPPLTIAGTAGIQRLIEALAKKADPGETRHLRAAVTAIVTAVALFAAGVAVESMTRNGRLVANGNDDYLQFRDFIMTSENVDEIVLLEHGRHFVSAVRSLPIYLRTWYGSNQVWRGRVVDASTRNLDDVFQKPGERLVAIDLTRAEWLQRTGRSPKEVLDRLEQTGEKLFESSGGKVIVYRLVNKQ